MKKNRQKGTTTSQSRTQRSSQTTRRTRISARDVRLEVPHTRLITVAHLNAPVPHLKRERIHGRRLLPRVPEGKEREFHSTSSAITFHRPLSLGAGPRAAVDDLAIATNSELTGPGAQQLASNVGEPSMAANGQVVFYTGNWYAARSVDGGQTFQYIDPFTAFPDPPNLTYCCDQVVQYIASIDTFVWLLQYGPVEGHPEADNIQRLAVAKTADVGAGQWRLFDITTKVVGVEGQFLDFPDLAVGANSLYITTNIFTSEGQSAGAAVVRIPVASITETEPVAQPFVSNELNSFRVAQNCGARAFFATHKDTSTLNVFTWDEDRPSPVLNAVEVARWITGNGYQSRTPDGRRWLDRADSRITGATLAGTDLYFAWAVDAGSNQRPQPFIQIAKIDSADLTLLENINVFDPDSATCYGALSTNIDNEVGISYMIGGGPRFPSPVVGFLTGMRRDVIAAVGERGPLPNSRTSAGEWGDYLTVRPVFPGRQLFGATGYTMKGTGDGSNRDSTPRYVVFGRASNATPARATLGPGPLTVAPRPPVPARRRQSERPSSDDSITDVNTLAVVSSSVAAKIKAAAGALGDSERAATLPQAQADSPGSERWPVKTGQDPDRIKVGKNVIDGVDLGSGIVESTVEELIGLPRPQGLQNAQTDPPEFAEVRAGVPEVTIWRIEASIIAVKHEKDGDYHLVLQSRSGQEMVAEIPTPNEGFVGDCPWIENLRRARQEIDDKLIRHLEPAAFRLVNQKYMPHVATTSASGVFAEQGLSFTTPADGSGIIQPLFQAAISPTQVRITGVGFFDRAHGATGAAPNVIELHPVLKVEWL